jgi:cell shape-determining protein MreC
LLHSAQAVTGAAAVKDLTTSATVRASELERLRTLDIEHAVLQSELAAVRIENETLRRMVHMASSSRAFVSARVYGDHTSPFGTLLISAGSAEGVREGTPVLLEDHVIFGTVEHVSTHTAVIRALSASSVERAVRIGTTSPLTYSGRGGSGLIEAPRSVPVTIGDYVFDTETGYVLGTVGYIDVSPEDAAQRIHVAPIITPSQATIVLIPISL